MSVIEGEAVNEMTVEGLLERIKGELDLDSELEYVRFLNHDLEGLKISLEKTVGGDEESKSIFKRSFQSLSNQLFKDLDQQKRMNSDMLGKIHKLRAVVGEEVTGEIDVDSEVLDNELTKNVPRIVPDRLDLIKELDQGRYSYTFPFNQLMTNKMPQCVEEAENLIKRREEAEQVLLDILEARLHDLDNYCKNQEEDKRHVLGDTIATLHQELEKTSKPVLRAERKWLNEFSETIDSVSETGKHLQTG